MNPITPEQLRQIFQALQQVQLEVIVVGGQAVNLWAYHYQRQNPALEQYLPFASQDLDVFGGKVEAMQSLASTVVFRRKAPQLKRITTDGPTRSHTFGKCQCYTLKRY